MGRREIFDATLKHIPVERVIVDLGGNPLSSMQGKSMDMLLQFLGYPVEEKKQLAFGGSRKIDERLLKHFNIDTRSVGAILKPKKSQYKVISENEYIDAWGIRRKFTGLYWDIIEHPLKGASVEDLNEFQWPDPTSVDTKLINSYKETAKKLFSETDYIICAEHPVYGIFELGCWMCGFDDFLVKMAINEDFVHRFFEIVLEYQKKVIDIYYGALGDYVHYTSSGDDFATQNSLFMSPNMFKELIKPYFKDRIVHTKKYTKAKFLHHSCGSVYPIINDLIDIGVDILNPIQPKAKYMEAERLKKEFGSRIVFHGGFDTQELLPYGNKQSIENEVKRVIDIMAKDGGYIFAAAHNIQEDVPMENIVYMLEAAKEYMLA